MKLLKKMGVHWLGWLLVVCMIMAGLTACGEGGSAYIDEELAGQVVSAAADEIIEGMLAEGEVQFEEESYGEGDSEETDIVADGESQESLDRESDEGEKLSSDKDEEEKGQPELGEAEGKNSQPEADREEGKKEEKTESAKFEESADDEQLVHDKIDEDGWYSDKESVALYIHLYNRLPGNYITKSEAEDQGWESGKGNLDEVAPGMSIGGNKFGNREGLLPKKQGRTYYECDINYEGGYRGGERIVYSNDGLVYYTEDHYGSFELLYTEEGAAE